MIVIGGSMKRLRARFRDQFAPVANGYAYRRGGRGPALPVGAVDADAFIAGFDRAVRWLSRGGMVAAVLAFGTLAALDVHASEWLVMVPYAAIWCALFWWAWNAPNRVLDGRAPLAPALTGPQVRRQGLQTLPWRALIAGMVLAIGLAVRVALEPDPLGAANRGYFALAAVLLLVFGGMAVAKLRTR